jgi:phage anti-repressor protein
MNELIRVTESESGKRVVSARELHLYLEVKNHFTQWFMDNIEQFESGVDYQANKVFLNHSNNVGGTYRTDYALTLDCAKEMAMMSKVEKGKEARKYFIACEKVALQMNVPKTRLELAKENVLLIEEIELKDALLLQQAPMVKAFGNVINNSATFTVDSLSDVVDIGRNKLFDLLRSWNWVNKKERNGTSSTRYSEENRFAKTLFEAMEINGKEVNKKRFVLTRKGFELAIKKLTK